MIVIDKETEKDVEVYGAREKLVGEENKSEFLIYVEETGEWLWVDADNYHPIVPEGTK